MNKFWGSNAQHGDDSQRHGTINFKVAKTLVLNCSHHKNKTMWCDRGVS